MPKHPPAAGYHRPNLLLGWPSGLVTPAMLAVADHRRYDDLWRAVQRLAAERLVAGLDVLLPGLGRLHPFIGTRTIYERPGWHTPVPPVTAHRVSFRPSDAFRVAVAGKGVATPQAWAPFMDDAADLATLPLPLARRMWPLMRGVIIKAVAKGATFDAPGIGTFRSVKRLTRVYRNWRTGALATAPASTLPRLFVSPALRGWMQAGAVPADL